MVIGREKGGWRRWKRAKGGSMVAERDLTLGGECIMQCADDVLRSCTLETLVSVVH